MIKLIDLSHPNANFASNEGEEIYIDKDDIKRIKQKCMRVGKEDYYPLSVLYDKNGNRICYVKESPEEILAMPDIEAAEKVIDWEQRRYEIAKEILPTIYEIAFEANDYMPPRELIAEDAIKYADALINELKKGQDNEN